MEKNNYEIPQNNNKEIKKIKNNINIENENFENHNDNELNKIKEDNNYYSPISY